MHLAKAHEEEAQARSQVPRQLPPCLVAST